MKSIGLALVITAALSGCQITNVEGEYRDLEVKYNSDKKTQQREKFCPPGQAKKGHC